MKRMQAEYSYSEDFLYGAINDPKSQHSIKGGEALYANPSRLDLYTSRSSICIIAPAGGDNVLIPQSQSESQARPIILQTDIAVKV